MEPMTKDAATAGYRTLLAIFNCHQRELQTIADKQFRCLSQRQRERFRKSDEPGSKYAVKVATSAACEKKNRYCDIIPFDSNRVKLGGNGYINASYIELPFGIPRRYIATQGPIQSTIPDFWQMVVEQDSRVIVCLTPARENGREKCAQYWPLKGETIDLTLDTNNTLGGGGDKSTFSTNRSTRRIGVDERGGGDSSNNNDDNLQVTQHSANAKVMRVRHLEEYDDRDAACIVRRIQVSMTSGNTIIEKTVTQLQFLGWSDHGVPDKTCHVIALVRLANQVNTAEAGPMVVHCSAGCGRTGTFCVIDSCAELLRVADRDGEAKTDQKLDVVYELADYFRDQRTTMVQAPGQYLYCYQALRDIVKEGGDRS